MIARRTPSAEEIRRLAASIARAADGDAVDALDHDEAGALMDALADDPARPVPPALSHHLADCADCRAAYDALVEVAFLERRGALPGADLLLARMAEGVPGAPARATASRRAARPAAEAPATRTWPVRWAVPALAAAAVVLAIGWAGSARRADGLARDLARADAALAARPGDGGLELARMEAMLRAVDTMRFAQAADGSWGRVVFHPDAREAMMWAGGLPEVPAGGRIACWLLRAGHAPELVWDAERLAGDQQWWAIAAQDDLSAYDGVAITLEPAGTTVVEVPLRDS